MFPRRFPLLCLQLRTSVLSLSPSPSPSLCFRFCFPLTHSFFFLFRCVFSCGSAQTNPDVLSAIKAEANKGTEHRKLFVRGLSWDTNEANLRAAFEK